MQGLDKAEATASAIDRLVLHASTMSLLLAILGGIAIAAMLKFPMHRFIKDSALAGWLLWVACACASSALSFATWPNNDPGAWAVVIGALTPLLWGFVLLVVKLLKPNWYNALRLGKVAIINEEVENDVRPSEPRTGAD